LRDKLTRCPGYKQIFTSAPESQSLIATFRAPSTLVPRVPLEDICISTLQSPDVLVFCAANAAKPSHHQSDDGPNPKNSALTPCKDPRIPVSYLNRGSWKLELSSTSSSFESFDQSWKLDKLTKNFSSYAEVKKGAF
jgi:hypothetical protein